MTRDSSRRESINTTYVGPACAGPTKREGSESDNRFPALVTNRRDTYTGTYIPAWLFALGLSAEALVTWSVMARLAGKARRLRGRSHAYISEVSGIPLGSTRRAIRELELAGVIRSLNLPGKASDFAFHGPPTDTLSWSKWMKVVNGDAVLIGGLGE